MNHIGEKLVVIHAEKEAIVHNKSIDSQAYMNAVKERIHYYLNRNKPVFFTRYGPNSHKVEYLEPYASRIIWVPKNGIFSLEFQADFVKSHLTPGDKHTLEFAGGFEFACFGSTISGIVGSPQTKIHKKEILEHAKKIVLYEPKNSQIPISGFAFRELIF